MSVPPHACNSPQLSGGQLQRTRRVGLSWLITQPSERASDLREVSDSTARVARHTVGAQQRIPCGQRLLNTKSYEGLQKKGRSRGSRGPCYPPEVYHTCVGTPGHHGHDGVASI